LWAYRGLPYSIHQQDWPQWDEEIAREEIISLIVQINGKVRDKIEVPTDTGEEELREIALASEKVAKWLDGRTPRQVIIVRGKLVNIVI
jgi:leucyl-tRNA synthetase